MKKIKDFLKAFIDMEYYWIVIALLFVANCILAIVSMDISHAVVDLACAVLLIFVYKYRCAMMGSASVIGELLGVIDGLKKKMELKDALIKAHEERGEIADELVVTLKEKLRMFEKRYGNGAYVRRESVKEWIAVEKEKTGTGLSEQYKIGRLEVLASLADKIETL